MTEYKETKRNIMQAFKINSVALTEGDLKLASEEAANLTFTAGTVLAISTEACLLIRVYLFSDSVGNCYYTAESNNEPVSFHGKQVWRGKNYSIRKTNPMNLEEKMLCNILWGISHLGH